MSLDPTPATDGASKDDWRRRLLASLRDCGAQRVRADPVLNWILVIGVVAVIAVITLVGGKLINEGFPSPGPGQPRQAPGFVILLWLAFNIFVLIRIRNKFLRRGWQVSAYNAEEKLRHAGSQRPILYLRSFQLDERIGRPGWIERILGTVPLRSFEQGLAKALDKYGPVIAIGRPDEKLPPLGAARFYVSHDRWQEKVADVAQAARYVVWATGTTEGLRWEVSHLIDKVPPEKIIIWAHPHLLGVSEEEREAEWTKFRTQLGGVFPKPLPEVLGPTRFIYFTPDWEPRMAAPPDAGLPALLRVTHSGQDLALTGLLCVKDGTVKEETLFNSPSSGTPGAATFAESIGVGPYGAAWKTVAGVFLAELAGHLPWTESFRRVHPILAVFWCLGKAGAGLLLFAAGAVYFLAESRRLSVPAAHTGEKLLIVTAAVTGFLVGGRFVVRGLSGLIRLGRQSPSPQAEPAQLSAEEAQEYAEVMKAHEARLQRARLSRLQTYSFGQTILGVLWLVTTAFFIMDAIFARTEPDRPDSWEPFFIRAAALIAVAAAIRWLVLGVLGVCGQIASTRLRWGAAIGAAIAVALSLPVGEQWYRAAEENRRVEELLRVANQETDEQRLRFALNEIHRHYADDPRFRAAKEALTAKILPFDFASMSPAEKAKHPQLFLEHMKNLTRIAADGPDSMKSGVEYHKADFMRKMEPYLAGNPELTDVYRQLQEMVGQASRLDKLQIDIHDPVVSFTSDGSALSIASQEKSLVAVVGVNDGKTFGKEKHRFAGLGRPFAVSVPGNRLASHDGSSRKIIVKEVSSGKQLASLDGFQWPGFLRFSPDESCLAGGGYDIVYGTPNKKLRVWDISKGTIKAATEKLYLSMADAVISADGKVLASVEDSESGYAIIWDVTNSLTLRWKMGPERHDKKIALSPDGQWCARGTTGIGNLLLNNPGQGLGDFARIERARFDPDRAFTPDGKFLTCETDYQANNFIKYWDFATKKAVFSQRINYNCMDPAKFRLHYTPGRSILATIGYDDDGVMQLLYLWDIATGKQTGLPTRIGTDEVKSVAFSANGQLLAVGHKGGTITLWKVPAAR